MVVFQLATLVVALICRYCAAQQEELAECLPWEISVDNGSYCQCREDLPHEMKCHHGVLRLDVNRCLTYENSTLFEASCPYIKYQKIEQSSIEIPRNLSQINHFFCDSLNREGFLCGRCKEGHGVSVLTLGYKCADCLKPKHGWLLYLLFQFVPITVLYLTIFILQVSIFSTSMNCFVFYSQMVITTFTHDELVFNNIYMASPLPIQTAFKIILTLYEPWNLDFFTHILPEFCISESIKNMHVSAMRCIPPIYFLLLIFLTYIILKLHNYKCQIISFQRLVRPIKYCTNKVRLIWDPKASVIDVIATLFILSCTKLFLSSVFIIRYSHVKDISEHPPKILYKIVHDDPTIGLFGTHHLVFITLCFTFTLLLASSLLLILYPFRIFQKILSYLRPRKIVMIIHTFADKFQGHFKNGTGGSRDMRLFSAFYFILRVVLMCFPGTLAYLIRGIILFLSSTVVLLAQPYKKQEYNTYDAMILVLLGLQAILVYIKIYITQYHEILILSLTVISLVIPQLLLAAYMTVKVMKAIIAKKINRSRQNGEPNEDPIPSRNEEQPQDRMGENSRLLKIIS